jgi:hypothetical protein
VPAGGAEDTLLVKTAGTDYATGWRALTADDIPTLAYSSLSGIPVVFPASPHVHAAESIVSGFLDDARIPESAVIQHEDALAIAWGQLTSVPTTFTPAAHTHNLSDITDAGTMAAEDASDYETNNQGVVSYKAALFDLMSQDAQILAPIVRLHEASNNGTNFVGVRSPASLAADYLWTLPTVPTADGVWKSSSGGVLTCELVDYSELTGVPSTFTPAAHTHNLSDISDAGTMAAEDASDYETNNQAAANFRTTSFQIQSLAGAVGAPILRLYEADINGTNRVGLRAPAVMATSMSWTLPDAITTNGVWKSDASGNLRCEAVAYSELSGVPATAGTAWPTTGLYDGLRFYRTDLGLWGTYESDGTRWWGDIYTIQLGNNASHAGESYRYHGAGITFAGSSDGRGYPIRRTWQLVRWQFEARSCGAGVNLEVINGETDTVVKTIVMGGPSAEAFDGDVFAGATTHGFNFGSQIPSGQFLSYAVWVLYIRENFADD